jgi:hypothetical protein
VGRGAFGRNYMIEGGKVTKLRSRGEKQKGADPLTIAVKGAFPRLSYLENGLAAYKLGLLMETFGIRCQSQGLIACPSRFGCNSNYRRVAW